MAIFVDEEKTCKICYELEFKINVNSYALIQWKESKSMSKKYEERFSRFSKELEIHQLKKHCFQIVPLIK